MASHSTDRPRSRSTGSTGSTYDPLKKYRNMSLSQVKPLTDKNRAAINPEVVPVLERVARGKGVGAQQWQALNRTASVSSSASDESAVSTWYISRNADNNNAVISHKREVVSKGGFKRDLPASHENWYEKPKMLPGGPSATKYDVEHSKIMFREGHYQHKEQKGDVPSYDKDHERELREAVKGVTLLGYFDDNRDEAGKFKYVQTFTRYHPSKRSRERSLGSNGERRTQATLQRAPLVLWADLDSLIVTIKEKYGLDEHGEVILDIPFLRNEYLAYREDIKWVPGSSERARRSARDLLMARYRYLSATAARRLSQAAAGKGKRQL